MQLEDDSAPSDRDQAGRISGAIFVAIRVRIAMRVERLIDRRGGESRPTFKETDP